MQSAAVVAVLCAVTAVTAIEVPTGPAGGKRSQGRQDTAYDYGDGEQGFGAIDSELEGFFGSNKGKKKDPFFGGDSGEEEENFYGETTNEESGGDEESGANYDYGDADYEGSEKKEKKSKSRFKLKLDRRKDPFHDDAEVVAPLRGGPKSHFLYDVSKEGRTKKSPGSPGPR